MILSRLAQAVRTNAIWCNTLCRAHGAPGEFYDAIWLNRSPVPRFYPNAVTLSDQRDIHIQRAHLETLLALNLPNSWGVKDSFCTLDLTGLGFQVQFEATWLWRAPTRITQDAKNNIAQWKVVRNESKLTHWEATWSRDPANASSKPQPRLFVPALLGEQDIAFLAAYQGDRIVAGAIANRTGDVVGLSNFFAPVADRAEFLVGCIAAAQERFPGLPLVSYQHGADLVTARDAGFKPLRDLRVWTRSTPT